ncbi:unnamed protein product [Rotaria socialis]|uniref:Uncharacterized protein n=1 Tax=Rotaria socialis TaxID=392032 RepID=A0A821NKT9_9BILA|nr:unnamed protein product [Rotaria socialis]CAF3413619.1 unnamed protein product [Rotaria socialis]CAF3478415.1 unnamed protein product [Rotaria socialis]CAF4475410.1 unnamed protein product [Rotaria socialis]CAF4562448.1 unnamed protein product [Rotaria socialis]
MHRGVIKNSWQDLHAMTSARPNNKSFGFDKQSKQTHHQQQTKATFYYETDHSSAPCRPLSSSISSINNQHERAKSADHSQMPLNETTPPATSSSCIYVSTLNNPAKTTSRSSRMVNSRSNGAIGTHASTIYIEELRKTQQECEKSELNTLNTRFGNYLEKIKCLASANADLRRQVDDAYKKYMGLDEEQQQIETNGKNQTIKKYQHPHEIQLNNLRKQINNEARAQTLIQIRLQRADYDMKFYQTNIKLLGVHEQQQTEQLRTMRQQVEGTSQELKQIQGQYQNREHDLQMYKNQYTEYINKLINFSNEYDKITYERMDNENHLCTLKEQLSFEHEYHRRRQEEFEYLEQFRFDLNKQFTKTEFHYIVQQIRKDYQELNDIRLSELEKSYKAKLDLVRNEISKREKQQETAKPQDIRIALDSIKQEHRTLIEQNQLLKDKSEQLENDLRNVTEQNRQRYETVDREYQKLQRQLPELDCIIVHLRENAGSLWSEINTYRYLLVNLLSSPNDKPHKSSGPCSPPLAKESKKATEKSNSSTTTENKNQESKISKSMVKPMINQVTKPTVDTKAKSPQQYRDETTGFIVHIEDGIIWVRI